MKRYCALAFVAQLYVTSAQAAPVEYVRVCDIYGSGWSYIPGTDVCFNPIRSETRQQTAGGTWRNALPNEPVQWVPSAAAGCAGGKLVNVATLKGTDLALNVYDQKEAMLSPVALGAGEYVASFFMRGDLTQVQRTGGSVRFTGVDGTTIPEGTLLNRADGVTYETASDGTIGSETSGEVVITTLSSAATSSSQMAVGTSLTIASPIAGVDNVATATAGFGPSGAASDLCLMHIDATGARLPLGCADLNRVAEATATLAFAPRYATPAKSLTSPVGLTASGRDWRAAAIEGSLELSACIRNVADTNLVTNGANGSNGSACTVADTGGGKATLSCPDGTTATFITRAPSDSGCAETHGASGLLVLLSAALLRVVRFSRRPHGRTV